MGTQEGYVVTGRHMSRCYFCGARTTLTKEVFCNGENVMLSVCYNCQDIEEALPKHPPFRDPITTSSSAVADAAKQTPLEKWTTTH